MVAEATNPAVSGSRWRSAKILGGLLALVLGAQLLVLAKSDFVGLALPEPDLILSPESLADPIILARALRDYDLTIYVFSDDQCPSCRLLSIAKTPALVIGELRYVDRLNADQLSQAIALARSKTIAPAKNRSTPDTARTGG